MDNKAYACADIVRAAMAAVAVGAALILTGCASGPVPGATARPDRATSSATASVEPVESAPVQRFDLGCEQLLASGDVTALFGSEVSPQKDTSTIESLSGPRGNAVRQLGGIVCLWSDGRPHSESESSAPGAWITVRPDADKEWAAYASAYGESTLGLRCPGSEQTAMCLGEYGIHGYWVAITINDAALASGATALGTVTPIVDRIRSVVSALPAPRPAWTPSKAPATIPADCEAFVPIESVRTALAQTKPLAYSVGDGWSLPGTITSTPARGGCLVGTTESDDIIVVVEWLSGGAWAYTREVEPRLADRSAEDAHVDGMRAGDSALWCDDTAVRCFLDLRVGGSWVRSTLLLDGRGATFSDEDREAAKQGLPALGAAIAASIGS
jgi:hypothetical protein